MHFSGQARKKQKKYPPRKKFLIFREMELSNSKTKNFLIFSQKKAFLILSQKSPPYFPASALKIFPKNVSHIFS